MKYKIYYSADGLGDEKPFALDTRMINHNFDYLQDEIDRRETIKAKVNLVYKGKEDVDFAEVEIADGDDNFTLLCDCIKSINRSIKGLCFVIPRNTP